jgi:hypothetical protein
VTRLGRSIISAFAIPRRFTKRWALLRLSVFSLACARFLGHAVAFFARISGSTPDFALESRPCAAIRFCTHMAFQACTMERDLFSPENDVLARFGSALAQAFSTGHAGANTSQALQKICCLPKATTPT